MPESVEVRFGSLATQELEDAVAWYDAVSGAIGDRFVVAIGAAVESIEKIPLLGMPTDRGCRYVLVSGFPYNLIYVVFGACANIVALAHERRRPRYWASRVRPH